MIKIIVDCFGGDRSPDANIGGALRALSEYPDLSLVLSGDGNIIGEKLRGKEYDETRLSILHAPDVISCNEKPTDAIRLKKESSMMKAVRLLIEDGTVKGMVSTGSTGALIAAGMLRVGRLKNVIRPAFCPVLPSMAGGIVAITDSGANVDISADQLLQYAVMANLYLQKVYGIERPRVALLNIGTEEEKGDDLRKAAYPLLSERSDLCFVGNIEAREALSGKADIIVADGFSGNILVKAVEGTALQLLKRLKKDIYSKRVYQFGALFMKKMFADEKEFMNYQNYGGSILIGTKKILVKGHGSSDENAVFRCICQAYQAETGDLNAAIEDALQ